jgi:hypothetical protein
MIDAIDRTSRSSSGRPLTRFSTTCWIVAGIASAESSVAPERFHSPVSSREMPPESRSERTSSFVKKGFPSDPARSRPARLPEIRAPPTSVSRKPRW